jgi:hypothetical protein
MLGTRLLFYLGVLCTPSLAVCQPIKPAILNTGGWLRVSCAATSAWKLPNGRIIYPDNPWLHKGWISSSWVGAWKLDFQIFQDLIKKR